MSRCSDLGQLKHAQGTAKWRLLGYWLQKFVCLSSRRYVTRYFFLPQHLCLLKAIHAFIAVCLVVQVCTMAFLAIQFLDIPFAQYFVTELMGYYSAGLITDLVICLVGIPKRIFLSWPDSILRQPANPRQLRQNCSPPVFLGAVVVLLAAIRVQPHYSVVSKRVCYQRVVPRCFKDSYDSSHLLVGTL